MPIKQTTQQLTRLFPTPILNRSITPSDTVHNLGVTFDSDFNFRKHISLTYRSCFYHIPDRCRIRRYISLSVAKTIAATFITSRLGYCNSVLYNIAYKNLIKLLSDELCYCTRTMSLPNPYTKSSIPFEDIGAIRDFQLLLLMFLLL